MPASVTVIVVSYGTRDLLEDCLRSVRDTRGEMNVQTIVVDNASPDGSADMVAERFPEVLLVRNSENVGFAPANNQALRLASGDLLLLLNSDAALLPGCLQALAAAFDAHAEVGICGPRVLNPDGSLQPSWGAFPTPTTELLFQSFLFKIWPTRFPFGRRVHPALWSEYSMFRQVDWVTGAALALRRAVYRELGGLPEHGFMYGEDLEFCALARDRQFQVAYVPDARVVHHLQGSRRDHARWIESYTEAMLGYYRRWLPPDDLARASRYIAAGSRLRALLWTVVPWVRPHRREEARSRREGYRRAAVRARTPRG